MFALTFLVALFGLYFIIDIQSALQKNRIRITKIRCKYFSEETKKLFKLTEDEDIKSYRKFLKDGKYLFAFSTTIFIGFFVDSFIIYQCIPLTSISIILLVLFFIFISYSKNEKINSDTNCDK